MYTIGADQRKQDRDQDHSKATVSYFMHNENLWSCSVCSEANFAMHLTEAIVSSHWFMGAGFYLQLWLFASAFCLVAGCQ